MGAKMGHPPQGRGGTTENGAVDLRPLSVRAAQIVAEELATTLAAVGSDPAVTKSKLTKDKTQRRCPGFGPAVALSAVASALPEAVLSDPAFDSHMRDALTKAWYLVSIGPAVGALPGSPEEQVVAGYPSLASRVANGDAAYGYMLFGCYTRDDGSVGQAGGVRFDLNSLFFDSRGSHRAWDILVDVSRRWPTPERAVATFFAEEEAAPRTGPRRISVEALLQIGTTETAPALTVSTGSALQPVTSAAAAAPPPAPC